jgi:hypothetical protein
MAEFPSKDYDDIGEKPDPKDPGQIGTVRQRYDIWDDWSFIVGVWMAFIILGLGVGGILGVHA